MPNAPIRVAIGRRGNYKSSWKASDAYGLLADARFADLAATATACAYLRDAAAQIKRYRQARD
jgi:hypothetical protein